MPSQNPAAYEQLSATKGSDVNSTSGTFSHLAALLRGSKSSLVDLWLARLRNDPKIPEARDLTELELLDFLPTFIDNLSKSLAQSAKRDGAPGRSGAEIGSDWAAKEHVQHRFNEHFSLAHELRELVWVRVTLMECCARNGVVLTSGEAQLVHSAIDELMITAAVEMEQGLPLVPTSRSTQRCGDASRALRPAFAWANFGESRSQPR